jgi:hypothetical protein
MCGAVMDAVMETTADRGRGYQQQARWTLAGLYVCFVSSNKGFLVVVQLQPHGCDDGVDDLSMPDSRGGYDNNQSAQTSIRSCFQQEDVVQCASSQSHQRRFQ